MSLIKAIRQQLGLSTTPSNNFTWDASADNGTAKLARGNAGATTQDIMTVDAAGRVTFPQNTPVVISAFSGAGSVGGDSSFTPLTGWTIDSGTSANAGSISGSGQWIAPVAGWYQVNHQTIYATSGVGGSVIISRLRKNSVAANTAGVGVIGAGLIFPVVNGSRVIYMNGTTDYLDVGAMQNSGSVAANVTNVLNAILIQRVQQ